MAVTKVDVEAFLSLAMHHLTLDVRSPAEFSHAHMPGGYSLPLFTDEERRVVGTAYKQESRQEAIKKGLAFFGPKMVWMTEEVEQLVEQNDEHGYLGAGYPKATESGKTVLVHCWRGGMRSAGVAWLLDLYGFKVYTLSGGYKAFRNWVLEQLEKDYPIQLVGGYTGSGKTQILQELKKSGCSIIDLEHLASHKGSAFGNIDLPAQPSQEMFENLLALELWLCTPKERASKPAAIWLEDESQRIGNVNIPGGIWKQMRTKLVYFLHIPFEERLDYILENYGKLNKEKMAMAILRIKKRLGGLETKLAIEHLVEGNLRECFRILLTYYDKWYTTGLTKRKNGNTPVVEVKAETVASKQNAGLILGHYERSGNV